MFTKHIINDSLDCLGILLCVRITQQQAFSLQRKKCPVAESWINGNTMLLWPRLQMAMDMHIDSVKRAAGAMPGSRATLSLTLNRMEDAKVSIAPHPLTQRYGQLLDSLLALSNKDPFANGPPISKMNPPVTAANSDVEPIGRSLQRLRSEFDQFLLKVSRSLPQGKRSRFLDNNYYLILTIVSDTGGDLAREHRKWFEQKRNELSIG